MRSFWAISLIFLLLINIFSVGILKLSYEANKDYFTQNFCINKDKPLLKCNGKCHLNKTIKKTEEAKGSESEFKNFNFAFEFETLATQFNFSAQALELYKLSSSLIYQLQAGIFSSIYRPPIAT